jgi:succinoglycan biosynthesis transport protein ExoP
MKDHAVEVPGRTERLETQSTTGAALEKFLRDQESESPLTRYVQILIRRRLALISLMVAGLIAALIINAMSIRLYRSSTTIEIARETARVVNVDDGSPKPTALAQEFYQTQYGLLSSRSLANTTAKSLNLQDNPTFLYGYFTKKVPDKSAALSGNVRDRELSAAKMIMANLTVEPVRGSSLVKISFDSPDPDLSAKVVNALANNFITSNLNRRFQASSYARNFLQGQLEQTRKKLEDSERSLVTYADQEKMFTLDSDNNSGTDGKSTQAQSVAALDLKSLNDALNVAKIDRAAAEARFQQANRTGGLSSTEGLNDGTISRLRSSRAELQSQYESLRSQFGPGYPKMMAISQQLRDIDRQISRQGAVVLDSLSTNYRAAVQREQSLQKQVNALKDDVISLRRRSIQYNIYQRDADTNRALYNALLQRYKEIGIAGGIGSNNVSIVDSGLPGRSPIKPKTSINIMLGLLLGLLAGAALAFMLEQLDESIIAPNDLERKLGIPLLGIIPRLQNGDSPVKMLADPKSPISEAYLSVQTALRLTTQNGAPRVMFVTSSKPSEGKSTTAVAIARNFATLGKTVILVDSDLRRPSVHKVLGLDNTKGLTDILSGAANLAAHIQEGPVPGMKVMTSGTVPPNPVELLAGFNLSQTFEKLLQDFNHVVVDGPPVIGLADAPLIASYAEATIYTIAAMDTHTRIARTSLRRLADVHANIIGAVLTKFDSKQSGYDYGYDYGYGEAGRSSVFDRLRRSIKRLIRR